MYQQHNFAHQHALSSPPQNQHYPQSVTGFNQPTHFAGVQGYPGASSPNALYAYQSPSMQGDPNTFAHMFKSHLAALTFNSKPIINQVTILAHENASQMAPVVAQCLEEHILTAPPPYRLPALYALDSICKNVGQPYTTLWSERIIMIFMETYKVVDHAVKGRMEELLNTWRNAGPQHSPLFGPMAQQSIERSIWGASGPPQARVLSPRVQQLQQPHNYARTNSPLNGSSTPTESGSMATILLARFDRLIDMCVYDQRHAPHMFDSTRMDALVKLRAIVASASLAPDELGQIVQQLDVLESEMQNRTTPQVRSPPQIRSPMHASSSSTNGYRATPPYQQQPNAVSFPPSLAGALASLGKLNSVGGSTPPSHRSTPPPLISGQKPNAALDLVASLRQAGLLPGAATVDQDAEYCQMIKGMEIKLTTHDLQREIPLGSLDAITNKELPLQCRQCANRYPAGAKGQASLDRHLDWHFRQNRRAKDSAARGQSRSWYSKLNDWVRGGHDDTIPPKRLSEGAEQNGGGASLTPAQEAELKAASKKFVVAPSDDPDAAATPCPICKELFKSEWSEDEEEWIWKNCIRVEGRYFHSSCHYSAMVLSQSVGRSTKDSSSDSSREITPQPHGVGKESIGSPPKAESKLRTEIKSEDIIEDVKLAGTKRKSDSDDKDGVQDDEDHSVPTKRTALA